MALISCILLQSIMDMLPADSALLKRSIREIHGSLSVWADRFMRRKIPFSLHRNIRVTMEGHGLRYLRAAPMFSEIPIVSYMSFPARVYYLRPILAQPGKPLQ